jgi:hypothetical protein
MPSSNGRESSMPIPKQPTRVGACLVVFLAAALALSTGVSAEPTPRTVSPGEVALPYLVGPEVYEIHTDARLYITRVSVNGRLLELGNAEGNGVWGDKEIRISGAIGYPNRTVFNGYLVPGKNEISVEFVPSPGISAYKDSEEQLGRIASAMFSRVAVIRGPLGGMSGRMRSAELGAALAENSKTKRVDVLYQKKGKPTKREVLRPVVYKFEVVLRPQDVAVRVKVDECEFDSKMKPQSIKGVVSLNGQPFQEVDRNQYTETASFRKALVSGKNTLGLQVESLDAPTSVVYVLECDLEDAKKEAGLMEKYSSIWFGSFMDEMHVPFAQVAVDKPGRYEMPFELHF